MSALTVTLGADITSLKRALAGAAGLAVPHGRSTQRTGVVPIVVHSTEKIHECAATEPNLVLYGDGWAWLTAEAVDNSGIRGNPQPQRGARCR